MKNDFFKKEFDLRVRLFQILAILGFLVSLLAAIAGMISGFSFMMLFINLSGAVLSAALLVFSWKTGKYQICYMITIVAVFLIGFPALFLFGGGYLSGMPLFFIFAVVFTVFMLEGKWLFLLVLLELVLYSGLFLFAYRNPERILWLPDDKSVLQDMLVSFNIVGLSLGNALFLHFRIHNKQKMQLEQARADAMAANEAKSLFLANMSHEIRTPVHIILSMNELILRECISKRLSSYAEKASQAGEMLLSLLSHILDISKIESGKTEYLCEEYFLPEFIQELSALLAAQTAGKELLCHTKADKRLPLVLMGDCARIKQIIFNFMSNAVKYTKEGSVELSFTSYETDGTFWLLISVSDTGCGISKENMKCLFEPFTRIDAISNRHIEGSGLGLAIAKQLAEKMQGEIRIESTPAKGSTFTLALPQVVVDCNEIGEISAWDGEKSSSRSSFTAPLGRILVVDDNKDNLEIIRLLLQPNLLQVDTAAGGEECLFCLSQNSYHVILMDMMMPEIDGMETMRLIRKQFPQITTPVVMLTANAVSGVEAEVLKAGFAAYLTKPIRAWQLDKVLLQFLPKQLVIPEIQTQEFKKDWVERTCERLKPYGIVMEEGLYLLSGDLKQYKAIAALFLEGSEEGLQRVDLFAKGQQASSLYHELHSLKSKAHAAGAMKLRTIAEETANHCKDEDLIYVQAALPLLAYWWRRACEGLLLLEKEQKGETKDTNS